MAKYSGKIGYVMIRETSPGVDTEIAIERPYVGDVIRNTRRLENGEGVNSNVVINNQFSVVGDAYAYENFFAIRYVTWMGARWTVTNVEVSRPRLLLTVGGVYNGITPGPSIKT